MSNSINHERHPPKGSHMLGVQQLWHGEQDSRICFKINLFSPMEYCKIHRDKINIVGKKVLLDGVYLND